MLAQIRFKLLQEWFPSGPVFHALFRKRTNAIEIITADEEIARETAAIIERIARCLGQLERFALALRHSGRVDDRSSGRLSRFYARLFADLLLWRFERRFHS